MGRTACRALACIFRYGGDGGGRVGDYLGGGGRGRTWGGTGLMGPLGAAVGSVSSGLRLAAIRVISAVE